MLKMVLSPSFWIHNRKTIAEAIQKGWKKGWQKGLDRGMGIH
jgi:hypothetical protein